MGSPRSGAGTSGAGEGLPRSHRIHRGVEIRALFARGKRRRGSLLDIFTAPGTSDGSRLGIVVPRYGHSIVDRNRLRRRLREIGRRDLLPRLSSRGCSADVLVRARPQAYDASFSSLREEFIRLTERLCSDAS